MQVEHLAGKPVPGLLALYIDHFINHVPVLGRDGRKWQEKNQKQRDCAQ
jgi:hypothetical protein